ncbi:MAG: TonB-dependent receptor, partial [Schleiferiaceae bacterium]|nr:TonB-dependent receptor [Schleiferiaceae bacterium]
MKTRFYIFAFIALNHLHAFAQFNLSGTVVDENNAPIVEALVTLTPIGYKTSTDFNGDFNFPHLKKGTYTLKISAFGYSSLTKEVYVDVQLRRQEYQLRVNKEELNVIELTEEKENDFGRATLDFVEGTAIYAGKKSEVVLLEDIQANLATNNSRQIYAKVAGLNIWESDGAGIQLGIGGRGLNPNRVSNFNTRQNGYDISADALGYPESYYSPATEAIERIEIVRGAASLQYGTQFGGFVNFKLREGPVDKPFEFTSRQTLGSFGLFNSFNSIGGSANRFRYYGFYQFKTGNGWRPNSQFDVQNAHLNLQYDITDRLKIGVEYTHMYYLAQQPGGLSDAMFQQDPRQSIRERNWFQVRWNLASLKADYKINANTNANLMLFGLIAGRDALGFLGKITRVDPGIERNLLMDKYQNFGAELRVLHSYSFLNNPSTFLIGTRYYNGFTNRKQGLGNDGSGPDFYYLHPNDLEHSEYDFPSQNLAIFTENIFHLNSKLSVTPGLRFEYINTNADGYYNNIQYDLAGNEIYRERVEDNRTNSRAFVLAGIGMSYKPKDNKEFYANISQNYRSINFNDMRIVNPNYRVDPNLKDEKGFSADIGFRGTAGKYFSFDVTGFMIYYNDRIGQVLKTDSLLFSTYRLRTNVADSRNIGIEAYAELNILPILGYQKQNQALNIYT